MRFTDAVGRGSVSRAYRELVSNARLHPASASQMRPVVAAGPWMAQVVP